MGLGTPNAAYQPRRALRAGGWMRLFGDRFATDAATIKPSAPGPAESRTIDVRVSLPAPPHGRAQSADSASRFRFPATRARCSREAFKQPDR